MKPSQGEGEEASSSWECNICFEALRIEQSCLTTCGHLYCWPCLHRWMDTFREKTSPPVCPVCKNVLNSERIIPIFGRGADVASDPRVQERQSGVPSRPPPQREEAPPPVARGPFDFHAGQAFGLNFSAGFFGPGVVFGAANVAPQHELTPEQRQRQQFMSQIMLFVGFAVLASLFLN